MWMTPMRRRLLTGIGWIVLTAAMSYSVLTSRTPVTTILIWMGTCLTGLILALVIAARRGRCCVYACPRESEKVLLLGDGNSPAILPLCAHHASNIEAATVAAPATLN